MKQKPIISGTKLNRSKGNAFAGRVSVYQPSLFAEEAIPKQAAMPSPDDPPVSSAAILNAQAIQELNALITAQYEMSKLERRIFLQVMEHLPDRLRSVEGEALAVSIMLEEESLLKTMELKKEEQQPALENAVQSLIRHVCWITDEQGPIQVGLFSSVQHLRGKKQLRVGIDPLVHPYLQKIKSFFDLAQLETLIQFKSFYSKCLYELFRKALIPPQGLYYPLPHLKRLLLIEPQEYERFSDLKRFVLERAKRDLATTYLAFTFNEKRTASNKVIGVRFAFHKLSQQTDEPNF